MELSHNPYRHLLYLRQSLSQDSKPLACFVSAGCPLAVSMPEGEWPLIPDVRGLTKAVNEKLQENENYKNLLGELEKSGKSTENIEDILSFIRGLLEVAIGGEVRGLTEKDLKELDTEVCKFVGSKLDVTFPSDETPYHKFAKWVRSIDRKTPVEIFTTNYDLLMEQALDTLEVPYFDGFIGSRRPFFDLQAVENNLIPLHWTRLWKIHGSINWYSEANGERNRVYRSTEITGKPSKLIYPSHLKYDESRKMPYLALIDQLNRFIREKSSFLILSGYSFNDRHLNGTIENALKANPTAMVLGLLHDTFMDGENERYPEAYRLASNLHNLNVWTSDKAIIGTNKGSWCLSSKDYENDEFDIGLRSFVSKEGGEEGKPAVLLVKLGDYAQFADFLKRTIGTQENNSNGNK